ncbi:MAG: hypothetical protein HZA01_08685 [Nitrospinae bacterium]|nr:hypothetical protein [Nitrospinota bacterium]
MNVLIISDNFEKEYLPQEKQEDFDFIKWKEEKIKPSLNEYDIFVIDLCFSENRDSLNFIKDVYLSLEQKLNRELIQEGLVLIIISGYENKKIFDYENIEEEGDNKNQEGSSKYGPEMIDKVKLTYDFLKRIDVEIYNRIEFIVGKRFAKPSETVFSDYFNHVSKFFMTLNLHLSQDDNFEKISKTAGFGSAWVSFGKKTGKGFLLIFPGYDLDKKKDSFIAISKILDIYYEKQQKIIFEKENDSGSKTQPAPV